MIKVTRFNQTELIVNADMIEFVEKTPDTVITMITGRKVLVLESADEVMRRVIAYRQEVGALAPRLPSMKVADTDLQDVTEQR